jgi:tetratricopeptide (TPR) repeat protein
VLGTLGRPVDASAEFDKAVRLQPENPDAHDAHYNLAIALAQQTRAQEAAREFGRPYAYDQTISRHTSTWESPWRGWAS